MSSTKLKTISIALIVIPLIIFLALKVFYKPESSGSKGSNLSKAAKEAYEQAEARIEKPDLPPKPAGETKRIPLQTSSRVKFGFGSISIPKTIFQEKYVGPTTEEMSAWEDEVEALNNEHEQKIEHEAEQLLLSESRKALKEEIKFWVAVLTPTISSITGVFTLGLAIKQHRREQSSSAN
jgi:hypothetical protein